MYFSVSVIYDLRGFLFYLFIFWGRRWLRWRRTAELEVPLRSPWFASSHQYASSFVPVTHSRALIHPERVFEKDRPSSKSYHRRAHHNRSFASQLQARACLSSVYVCPSVPSESVYLGLINLLGGVCYLGLPHITALSGALPPAP